MSRYAVSVATAILFACFCPVLGQAVLVEFRRPPPAQLKFEDLWVITLRNSTSDTWPVYIHAEVYEMAGGAVFAANTQDMYLAPGESSLAAKDIRLSDIWFEKGYRAFATPESPLPEGDYIYELTLSPTMTRTSCVLQVRSPTPLELLWPPSGAVVRDSVPLFVWTRPVIPRYAGEYRYSMRMAEMQSQRTCSLATEDPVTTIEPCLFSTTSWRYPSRAPRLVRGKSYAWRVEACDTAGVPVDASRPMMRSGYFVYRPGESRNAGQITFESPRPGEPVYGGTFVRVKTGLRDSRLCVLEYSLGSDSCPGDWRTIGSFAKTRDLFVGRWNSDSAVKQEGLDFGCRARLRATVLGRKGQKAEVAVKTVVEKPPERNTRGCGCH